MRFIAMHKTNADNEAGILPPAELIENMGKLMGEMARASVVVAGDGLRASSTGVRLNFSGGTRTVTPGPFVGRNELLAGFTIIRVPSIDDAIEWATRFADVIGDVEFDIRPVVEAWDLGMFPKPEGLKTTRFMLGRKASPDTESGAAPAPETLAGIEKLTRDMSDAGVLVSSVAIEPSSKGRRLNFSGGKRTMTDGPFTESKELIAGFVILDVPSLDGMMKWIDPFAAIIGDVEIDIRPVFATADVEAV